MTMSVDFTDLNEDFVARLQELVAAAEAAGYTLVVASGFRADDEQEAIFLERYEPDVNGDIEWDGRNWRLKVDPATNRPYMPAAPPGQSLHNHGYAVDFSGAVGPDGQPTELGAWLMANAATYGLRTYAQGGEPGHIAPAEITNVSQIPEAPPVPEGTPQWDDALASMLPAPDPATAAPDPATAVTETPVATTETPAADAVAADDTGAFDEAMGGASDIMAGGAYPGVGFQPEYVRSEIPHEFADVLGIPGGYDLIAVGADKYLVYQVTDPNMPTAATAHVYFRVRAGDESFDAFGPPSQTLTPAVWDQRQAGYLHGGFWTDLQSSDYAGRDWQQIVDWAFDATHYGGTLALEDVDIMKAIAVLLTDLDLDLSEGGDFENLIRGSDWWENHTNAENVWDLASLADRERMIGQKAVELALTFEYYTGQPIDTSPWFAPGGTAVNVELLQNYSNLEGTQDFYGLAFSVLTGRLSDPEIVASVIKPLASDVDLYPNSPHLRRLEEEERQTGARASLVGRWKSEVRQMYEAQGIQPTPWQIDRWAEPLYMNTTTIDEAQEAIEAAGLAEWPHKPVGMDWRTWADPYTAAYANILELAAPTFTNDDLRTALGNAEQVPNLWQFKQDLRQDPRWLDTKNARDSYYGTFGRIGRLMGFG